MLKMAVCTHFQMIPFIAFLHSNFKRQKERNSKKKKKKKMEDGDNQVVSVERVKMSRER